MLLHPVRIRTFLQIPKSTNNRKIFFINYSVNAFEEEEEKKERKKERERERQAKTWTLTFVKVMSITLI
jgi:hypothetical protein